MTSWASPWLRGQPQQGPRDRWVFKRKWLWFEYDYV
jgi:hypothetical protein